MKKLEAWAYGTTYPVPLGNIGGARKLHIWGSKEGSYRALCGVVLEARVEDAGPLLREVCVGCRRTAAVLTR